MNATARPVRYTIRDAGDAIRRRETFVAGDGSLSGGYLSGRFADAGRLSTEHTGALLTSWEDAEHAGGRLYVVRSYGTPIAWAGPGEPLTVPDVHYSVTTSRHQGIARRADACPECNLMPGAHNARCSRGIVRRRV